MATEKAAALGRPTVRCIAGEFNGSVSTTAKEPKCLRSGVVAKQVIQYHMDNIDSAEAAARAADQAREATETAEVAQAPINSFLSSGPGQPQRRQRSRPQWA